MTIDLLVYLAAAVIAVPLAKRAGLGSVLGYLIAGCVIGPWGLRLISDVESIGQVSEFGVVLMLFLIGLELEPKRAVEAMRRRDLRLGRRAAAGQPRADRGDPALALPGRARPGRPCPLAHRSPASALAMSSTAIGHGHVIDERNMTCRPPAGQNIG